jgi:autotransporter-associated beta strand protein
MRWFRWKSRRRSAIRSSQAVAAGERLESRLALSVALGLVPTDAQPQGPLTGRVVYTSGGHGWQWNDTLNRWATDRPNLLGMVEDFGNQDQLTLYAEYLFQAGATVVPMRPVGRQLNEVVLDNDSPEVVWSGSWSINTAGPAWFDEDYGAVTDGAKYRFAAVNASQETATAVYAPTIPEAGLYPVYVWASAASNRTDQLYRVNHAGGSTEVRVDHRKVGNGWVWLGSYQFEAGRSLERGSVTISNRSAAGGSVVIADAVRFGNGMGDLPWGPGGIGTGSVSGYPREDEGSLLWAWRAVGQSTAFSSPSTVIGTSNVSAPLRMAEHMNVDANPYGTSIYVGFHSNATTGNPATAASRGAIGLIHSSSPTPNQASLAATMAEQINLDLRALDGTFEHDWSTRTAASTLKGSYGEITNSRAAGEFDATIIEVAFHDNTLDAELLRDPRARDQIARSTYEATLEHFFNFPGSLPKPANVTLPSPPQQVQAVAAGDGAVTVSWRAGTSSAGGFNGVFGSPATGFRVYASVDGVSFDGGTVVAGGAARSVTLTGLDPERPYFFRVVAENAGGRSRPTEVVGAMPAAGRRQILVVNGFDRLDRSQNFVQAYSYGGGGTTERVWAGFNNPRDQVGPTIAAIAAAAPGVRVDATSNEAVIAGSVGLAEYDAVVWILGNESLADRTFDATEQTLVSAFVAGGGSLFVSGSEPGYDLDTRGNGQAFFRGVLGARAVADDAATYRAAPVAGGLFAGLPELRFSNGAAFSSLPEQRFNVAFPDVLAAEPGGEIPLTYVGGLGGGAATYRPATAEQGAVVVLGFPFESIVGGEQRAAVMGRVLEGLGVAPVGNAMLLEVDAGEEVVDATPRAGGEQLVKRGAGTVILTAASQHSGGTLVEAGTLVIRDPAALGSGGLVVKAGSRVVVDLGGMQLPLAALDLAAGATLDLGAGAIRIAPGGLELAMLQSLVTAGRAGGSWTGAGITSSAAVGQPFYAVGIRPLADGSLLAGFAAVGDANLDGSVDIQDLILVSAGGRYGSGAADAGWWQGDFNDDRRVTIGDLVILVASSLYGAGPYRPLGSTAVAASW